MANELVIDLGITGLTVYSLLFATGGTIYNGAVFEPPTAADWTSYAITMTEASTTGIYQGDMPSVVAGNYGISVREQSGGSPATTDSEVGVGDIAWTGAAQVTFPTNFPVMSITASGYLNTSYPLHKNTAYDGFAFYLSESANPLLPCLGAVVTGKVAIDNAAPVALTNAAHEIGSGLYYVNLAAADLNCSNEVTLLFTAPTAVGLSMKIPLQS